MPWTIRNECEVPSTVKAASGDRLELLDTLYGALSSYIREDLSWLLARCDEYEEVLREVGACGAENDL